MEHLTNITVRAYASAGGRFVDLPGLTGNHGMVTVLARYLLEKHSAGLSQSTLIKIREAFRLFYEYSSAVNPADGFGLDSGQASNAWQHFARFRDDLLHGTFDPETGDDPSGLGKR